MLTTFEFGGLAREYLGTVLLIAADRRAPLQKCARADRMNTQPSVVVASRNWDFVKAVETETVLPDLNKSLDFSQ